MLVRLQGFAVGVGTFPVHVLDMLRETATWHKYLRKFNTACAFPCGISWGIMDSAIR